jgi:uncharacterized membrane protein HdeD (DUF308 family)
MDRVLILGVVLLVTGIVGTFGLVEALRPVAWPIVVIGIVLIAWRIVAGRRPS